MPEDFITPPIDFRMFKIDVRAKTPDGLPKEVSGKVLTYNKTDTYGTNWGKGCLIKSVEARMPIWLWAHAIGDPIGRAFDFTEHRDFFELALRLDDFDYVPRARQAAYQIKEKTIDEFSVGFTRVASEPLNPKDGAFERVIEARCHEVSSVPYGSVPETGVIGMRAVWLPEEAVREIITIRGHYAPKRDETKETSSGTGDENNKSGTGETTGNVEENSGSGNGGDSGANKEKTESNSESNVSKKEENKEETTETTETTTETTETTTENAETTGENTENTENNKENVENTGEETTEERSTYVKKVTDGKREIRVVSQREHTEDGAISTIIEKRRQVRESRRKAREEELELREAEKRQAKIVEEANKDAQLALTALRRSEHTNSVRGRKRR